MTTVVTKLSHRCTRNEHTFPIRFIGVLQAISAHFNQTRLIGPEKNKKPLQTKWEAHLFGVDFRLFVFIQKQNDKANSKNDCSLIDERWSGSWCQHKEMIVNLQDRNPVIFKSSKTRIKEKWKNQGYFCS